LSVAPRKLFERQALGKAGLIAALFRDLIWRLVQLLAMLLPGFLIPASS
jgi:hypothetical protein